MKNGMDIITQSVPNFALYTLIVAIVAFVAGVHVGMKIVLTSVQVARQTPDSSNYVTKFPNVGK